MLLFLPHTWQKFSWTKCRAFKMHTRRFGLKRAMRSVANACYPLQEPSVTRKPSLLAAMPTSLLLRSLFISFVSSKPVLLSPTLSSLSFLSKQKSTSLINVDRNPFLHFIVKNTFFKQFCAGETGPESQATMRRLLDAGFGGTILTYAKETVFDHSTNSSYGLGTDVGVEAAANEASTFCPSIEAWRAGTMESISLLGPSDHLAIKMTGAGGKVTEAFANGDAPPQQMVDAMHDICRECKRKGIRILIDAESQHFQRGIATLSAEMTEKYNRDGFAVVYNTYQAYLKGTRQRVIRDLQKAREGGYTLGLKLVRGAYLASDQRDLIFATKRETDDNYNKIARGVISQSLEGVNSDSDTSFPPVNLLLATHNRESAVAAFKLHKDRVAQGLRTVPVLFAQLHGMADHLSFELIQMQEGSKAAPQVLKCSTWGTLGECLAYLLRRAAENRQAVGRSREEYDALRDELYRRICRRFSPQDSL